MNNSASFLRRKPPPAAFLVVVVTIWLSDYLASCQNYNTSGPYDTKSYDKRVKFMVPATGKAQKVTVTVTYPSATPGPFPLVIAFNGFVCDASWYTDTVQRVASWGYFVMQYTVDMVSALNLGEDVEVTYLQPLLDWLKQETAPGSGSASAGQADMNRKAVLGHSRGGKLATLHYANRTDITTAVLLDPVDCTPFASGPSHPSAVAAMGGGEAICGDTLPPLTRSIKTAAVIGAGYVATVPCNPPSSNYEHFAAVLGAGTWKILIPQAGHMQFPNPRGFDPTYNFIDFSCGKGDIKTKEVVEDARTIAVAWLESKFRAVQFSKKEADFWQWMQDQQAKGTLTFEKITAGKGVQELVTAGADGSQAMA